MSIHKSIIEDMELSTGTQVTVQGSQTDKIVLSIDGESNHSFYITALEALKLASLLQQVVAEQAQ